MNKCGEQGNRCHTIQRPQELKRSWDRVAIAECKCQSFHLTATKYKRMQQGINYICKTCKSRLVILTTL